MSTKIKGRSKLAPMNTDLNKIIHFSILLCVLYFVGSPMIRSATELSNIAVYGIIFFIYSIPAVIRKKPLEALIPVTYVFSIIPISVDIPIKALDGVSAIDGLTVYIVLPLSLLTLFYLCVVAVRDGALIPLSIPEIAAILSGTGFVLFLLFALPAGGYTSNAASLVYSLENFSFLILFLTTFLICKLLIPWVVIIPLLASVVINAGIAFGQIISYGIFGIKPLSFVYTHASVANLGPVIVRQGMYGGSFVGHARELSLIILLTVPLIVALLEYLDRRKGLSLAMIFLGSSVVFASGSQAGIGSLLAIILMITLFYIYKLSGSVSKIVIPTALSGGILVLAYRFLMVGIDIRGGIFSTIIATVGAIIGLEVDNLGIRVQQYIAAIEIAKQNPIFGVGGYNTSIVITQYIGENLSGIHNLLLTQLVSSGIPGTVLYTAFIGSCLLILTRKMSNCKSDELVVWYSITAGVVGFGLFSSLVLSHYWHQAHFALWIILAVIAGTKDWNKSDLIASSQCS